MDLSEAIGKANRLKKDDPMLTAKVAQISGYVPTNGVPNESVMRMARLGVVIDNWMTENKLQASAIQCWTAMQEFYGLYPAR
jgi:L-fucose isomerase-like protein